jgi:hypothetical protein
MFYCGIHKTSHGDLTMILKGGEPKLNKVSLVKLLQFINKAPHPKY